MVDVDAKKLEGEMLDLQHGCTFFPNPKAKINAGTGKKIAQIFIHNPEFSYNPHNELYLFLLHKCGLVT